ncbi:ARID DNA-binding domain-containing protein [Tanacetum coccineum]
MVNHNRSIKNNWLQNKPVQHWYQSQGIENGMKPIHKHDQGGVNRGYLLRETPQRLLSWNNRKKSLSPGCKEMLLEKMKEIEAFNASRVSAKAKNQGKGSASTQKEKRVRCYICKIRGHVFWKCPNKKKKIMNGKAQGEKPKDEGSLVKGPEELEWDRKDVHDYVDEEYISWNGTLYSLKVNSFSRFLSFMNLMKEDSIVYKHWEIFSKKYVEMLKWFYLVYLNYDMLEKIPPVVGVMEIYLLSLHKIVDSLGGYLCVTLGDKWKTVASIQGLTYDNDGEAIKGCYRKFIDMVQVYYETAKKTWFEKEPKGNVVGSSSGDARVKYPQGKDKDEAGKALGKDMNKKSKFGVSLEGNLEKEAEEGSVTDSNDLEVVFKLATARAPPSLSATTITTGPPAEGLAYFDLQPHLNDKTVIKINGEDKTVGSLVRAGLQRDFASRYSDNKCKFKDKWFNKKTVGQARHEKPPKWKA